MKVLFVTASMAGGGAERVFATLLAHLDRQRFSPHLALLRRRGDLLADIPSDVPLYELGGSRLPQAAAPLWRLLGRLRPEVVCSTLTHVNVLVGCVRRFLSFETRLILRETNLPSHNLQRQVAPGLMRRLYPFAYRQADAVICQGEFMKQDVARWGVPENRLVTLSNPLDIQSVQRKAREGADPFAPGTLRLVAGARLSWEKGLDLLLDAVERVCRKRDDVHLYLLGSGPEEQALRRQAERAGIADRVHFAGFVDNPYPYFAHADLFVLSSRFEPFSNAVAEALACGTPVLTVDCPGDTPGLIREGVNGWHVPAEDADAMARRILELTEAERPPRDVVARTVEGLGVDHTVRAYQNLFLGKAA